MDKKPQRMDMDRAGILCNIAELVTREMEAVWAARQQRLQSLKLLRAMDSYRQAFMFVDVAVPQWKVLYMNEHAIERTGKVPGFCTAQIKPGGLVPTCSFEIQNRQLQAALSVCGHGCDPMAGSICARACQCHNRCVLRQSWIV